MATIEKTIGANLLRIRKNRGISQMELGEKVGVSFQQIQKYEKGATRISVLRLQQLAAALNAPISAFLQEKPTTHQVAGPGVCYGRETDVSAPLDLLTREEALLLKLFRLVENKKIREGILRQLQGTIEIEKPKKSLGKGRSLK